MSNNIHPNVYSKIMDLSNYTQQIPSTIGLICALTKKGPDNTIYFVNGQNELITKFGLPNIEDFTRDYSQGLYIANNFVKESGALYFVRCMPDDASYSTLRIDITQSSGGSGGSGGSGQPSISYLPRNEGTNQQNIIQNLNPIVAAGEVEDPGFPPPIILSNPEGGQIYEGESFDFNVMAIGESVQYRWFFNGNEIEGATNSTYSIIESIYGEEGETGNYKCRVFNSSGEIWSDEVYLEVLCYLPFISVDLQYDEENYNGHDYFVHMLVFATHEFVIYTEGENLTYQWYFNGSEIPEATNSTLSVYGSDGNTGYYKVRITNDCGSVFSIEVFLQIMWH